MIPAHAPGRPDRHAEEELANALLAYLDEHPQAMDTLEGIAEWWLVRQQVRVVVERVARVLRRLCDEGVLEAVGTGEDRRFRLRPRAPGVRPDHVENWRSE
jgi:hypothetical protein